MILFLFIFFFFPSCATLTLNIFLATTPPKNNLHQSIQRTFFLFTKTLNFKLLGSSFSITNKKMDQLISILMKAAAVYTKYFLFFQQIDTNIQIFFSTDLLGHIQKNYTEIKMVYFINFNALPHDSSSTECHFDWIRFHFNQPARRGCHFISDATWVNRITCNKNNIFNLLYYTVCRIGYKSM